MNLHNQLKQLWHFKDDSTFGWLVQWCTMDDAYECGGAAADDDDDDDRFMIMMKIDD